MKLIAMLAALLIPMIQAKDVLVNCRFVGFESARDGTTTLVAAGKDGKTETITLPHEEAISQPVVLKSEKEVITFRKADSEATAATATIPNGAKDIIVLFSPTEKEGLVCETIVLNSSARAFPTDTGILLNHCQQKAKVTLGEREMEPKPDEPVVFGRPKQIDEFNMAGVKLELETAGSWRTVFESNVRFIKGQRSLLIAHIDPESKRPRLWIFQE